MPYVGNHVLFRGHGSFGLIESGEIEYFSWGLRIFISGAPLVEQDKADFLLAVQGATKSFWVNSESRLHAQSFLKRLTAAFIGPDGKYVGGDQQPTTEYIYSVAGRGAGGNTQPYSQAACLSLWSEIDRGPGHSGRIYLPSGHACDGDGGFQVGHVASLQDVAKTWVDNVNTAARTVWPANSGVAVFSKVGTGLVGPVTRISVGRAPDTQRRRDNRVPEDHNPVLLATAAAVRAEKAARRYDDGADTIDLRQRPNWGSDGGNGSVI